MQASNIPSKVPLPFANSGTKNTIPTASQIGITPGAASLTDGFPPLTMTPLASGGVPPAGADFNGILNLITAIQQWQSAGGSFKYDSAFSTSVGGYPKGAVLVNLAGDGMWLNVADNNTTNPDATDGSAANWAPVDNYGVTTIALTNANVTLTPAQFGKSIIILTGTLTGNVQLTMPKLVGTWYVVNSTTGAFTTQMLTASGTPLTIAQGGSVEIRGDGTNVNVDALQVAPATQSQHAMQLGQQGIGQCRLSVVSSTQLLLSAYNGNVILVNGAPVQIPGAGLTLSNAGLLGPVAVSSYSITSNVMTLTTSTAHGLSVGSRVYIENEAIGANGSYVVTAVGSSTTFSFALTHANASGSESGCTAQPVYYAYVQVAGGVPALVASQVGYTIQSNGIATQTGNTALTLVGMFMVNGSGFIDSDAFRWCLNWFNRRVRRAAVVGGSTNFTTTVSAEVNTAYRARFMMWADDVPQVVYNGTLTLTTATASSVQYGLAIDSVGNTVTPAAQQTMNGTWSSMFGGAGLVDGTVAGALIPNEGGHTTLLLANAGANGGTWQVALIQTDVSFFG